MDCNQSTSFGSQSSRELGNNNPSTISNVNFETPEDTPPKGQNESSKESAVSVVNLDKSTNEIIPKEAQSKIEPKPLLINNIATMLAGTNIIDPTKYGSCEVSWNDPHLQVLPGLNILAVCRNIDCKFHLKDVMCPKGIYPENNGYCPFDKEIHKVHCPVCKQRIKFDNSFGYCFYQCKFEIKYMLDNNNSGKLNMEASNNTLIFAKCSNSISGHLQYLELQFYKCHTTPLPTPSLHLPISGGASNQPTFVPIEFYDVTNENCFRTKEFSFSVTDYGRVCKGINFQAECTNNPSCISIKASDSVYIQIGMCGDDGGLCPVRTQITKMFCPACKCKIPSSNWRNMVFTDCTANIEWALASDEDTPGTTEIIVPSGKCYRAKTICEIKEYSFLNVKLK